MELHELMNTNPDTLAVKQRDALKEHILRKLTKVREAVQAENFALVESMTSFSAAGDGHGSDNHFIDFSYNNQPKDIMEICDELKRLNEIIASRKEGEPPKKAKR